jgi:hypothetical protein
VWRQEREIPNNQTKEDNISGNHPAIVFLSGVSDKLSGHRRRWVFGQHP